MVIIDAVRLIPGVVGQEEAVEGTPFSGVCSIRLITQDRHVEGDPRPGCPHRWGPWENTFLAPLAIDRQNPGQETGPHRESEYWALP